MSCSKAQSKEVLVRHNNPLRKHPDEVKGGGFSHGLSCGMDIAERIQERPNNPSAKIVVLNEFTHKTQGRPHNPTAVAIQKDILMN